MALVRMFHYSCDSYRTAFASDSCANETGDEWYALQAKERALGEGWHINATKAICPECWDNGTRYKNCR